MYYRFTAKLEIRNISHNTLYKHLRVVQRHIYILLHHAMLKVLFYIIILVKTHNNACVGIEALC